MKVGILGAGSWGIALSMVLNKNGHDVAVWSIVEEEVQMLNEHHEHIHNLPGISIDESILISSSIEDVVKDSGIVVFAVPSRFVRSTAEAAQKYITEDMIIVNVGKGLEDKTLFTLAEVLEDVLKNNPIAVLSGPSHAEEVARNIPTSVVAACKNESVVAKIQEVFMNQTLRVYGSSDLIGVEMGGALKNVIALAAGISDGLGFGDNTKAALMTRGMTEIARLGNAMGADPKTFNGLSGIGDLIVTCTSMHSRNRRAGILIGEGASLEEAQKKVNMVVEGVYAAKAALELAKKYKVELPIIEQVNEVLFDQKNPREAVIELMERDRKFE
jgi:glycerol-3-phosphate dehydrogenase (NAD(P)+)